MKAQRGTRGKLEDIFEINLPLTVRLQISGAAVYDFSCFGVDANEKLSDDRYMIFYNQTASPQNEITYAEISGGAEFTINLSKIPSSIQKLVFTGSIDGAGTMGEISSHKIFIAQDGKENISAEFGGGDFQNEKAITALEIYRKNGWRFNVVARGFDGGVDVLLKFFGGEQIDEPAPPPPPEPKKISLEKKISEGAPALISLVKPLKVELEKRNLLDVVAKVALVMDISGSMTPSYDSGAVQEIVNKILPIAVQFDDDGELDFRYFGSQFERRPTVNMQNYKNAVPADWDKIMQRLGYGTDAIKVMNDVIAEYEGSKTPAYVIFITDGEISNETRHVIIGASKMPIFWQFVGIGNSTEGLLGKLFGGYGLLEKLDTLKGRYVDNTNFFALDDFNSVSPEKLYSRLLNEFPTWLKEIRRLGMI